MLIFQQCRALIGPPITLTHTCRRWRQIAVTDASLWTNIIIKTRRRNPNARLDHFLSFLGMQLDRTANLLLDVEWGAEIGDEFFVATLHLIREKAPFSRWRKLDIDLFSRLHENAPWSSVDAFTSLEVLCCGYMIDNTIYGIIDRTITSRLKLLNFRFYQTPTTALMSLFPKLFTHISTLSVLSLRIPDDTPFPPKNVVKLQLDEGRQHPFPHIRADDMRI
jgi:F-box-like